MLLFGINGEDNIGSVPLPKKDGVERVLVCCNDNRVKESSDYVEYRLGDDKLAIYRQGRGINSPILYIIDIDISQYLCDDVMEYLRKMVNTHVIVYENNYKCFMTKTVGKYVKEMLVNGRTYEAVRYYRSKRQDNIRRALVHCIKKHYDLKCRTKIIGNESDKTS